LKRESVTDGIINGRTTTRLDVTHNAHLTASEQTPTEPKTDLFNKCGTSRLEKWTEPVTEAMYKRKGNTQNPDSYG
jgi:hypothetical protein